MIWRAAADQLPAPIVPATTPGAEMLWGLLPRPVAIFLAVVIAVAWVVADVTGKLGKLGPIYKAIRKHRDEREQQRSGWRERDAEVVVLKQALERLQQDKDQRVTELKETVGLVNDQVQTLKGQRSDDADRITRMNTELQQLHAIADAQYRAIRRHIDWDRVLVSRAREAGIDVPEPPALYIAAEETDPHQ